MLRMASTKKIAHRWALRLYGVATVWSVVPPTIAAALVAYFSTPVDWISQFGWFGIIVSGLVGYAIAAFGMAQTAKARLNRMYAEHRAVIHGESSSSFDPLAKVYENKRLYLRDLAPVGRRFVKGKTFINCEIIGPGSAVLGTRSSEHMPFPSIRDSAAYDVDCIEIDPSKESMLAIGFPDCDFIGCQFFHMTLLSAQRDNDTLHWITKDSRQALLPEADPNIEGMHVVEPRE
jgi:hypothetical protein